MSDVVCYTPLQIAACSFDNPTLDIRISLRSLLLVPSSVLSTRDRVLRRCLMEYEPRPNNENHILSRLPPEDYERFRPHLEPVKLRHGQILQQAGEPIDYIYFPHRAMISRISHTATGESVEVGVV